MDGITFSIGAGEVFRLLGPNGAGKRTTIRMLACLISPSSGSARIGGYDIRNDSLNVREIVGILTENPSLCEKLTAFENIRNDVAGMNDQQAVLYITSVYLSAPFFLIIPLMASSVISSDSFSGEKKRKTIELLATPLSDGEFVMGKILVSFVPAMVMTLGSLIAYSTVVDVFAYGIFNGRLLLPNLLWIMLGYRLDSYYIVKSSRI